MTASSDLVYEAERLVHYVCKPTRFGSQEEAWEFLHYVVNTRWFMNRWPKVARSGVSLSVSKHASAWSDLGARHIWLPFWACNTFTLLHELAHICSQDLDGDHGPAFRAAHLDLVKRFMGVDAARAYKHSMIALGLL